MSFFSPETNQYFPSGWNDPPANPAPSTGNSSITSQRKRRPLDPSVQQENQNSGYGQVGGNVSGGYAQPAAPNYQQPQGINFSQATPVNYNPHVQQPYNTPPPNFQSPYVQPPATQASISTAPQQFSTHPASAFNPVSNQGSINPQKLPETIAPLSHHQQPGFQGQNPQLATQQGNGNAAPMYTGDLTYQGPQLYRQQSESSTLQYPAGQAPGSTNLNFHPQTNTQMIPVKSYEEDQKLIFSPPNTVNFEQQRRPTTQPDPNTYIAPTKAAGDVSLSGPQLVSFLIKATVRLQQGPMREGIQLKIGQLNDFVNSGQLSEPCLKKLNFVVDAVDRGSYDEAQKFFDEFGASFPEEMNAGVKWIQGLRFLILELKKQKFGSTQHLHHYPPNSTEQHPVLRAGSAGTRLM